MSVILVCRRILEGTLKPKAVNLINSLKLHTVIRQKVPVFRYQNVNISTQRTFFKWFRKSKPDELKIIDDIPDHFKLIHRNTMERYILYAQLGTTITTAIVCLGILVTYEDIPKERQLTFYGNQEHPPRSTQNEYEIYLALFFTIVVLLQLLATKMPLRIYYLSSDKKYIMILPSNLPFNYKRLTYKIGDIEKLPLSGILPWKDSRFRIKNEKEVILIEEHFRRPADLWVMLGVQRDHDGPDN